MSLNANCSYCSCICAPGFTGTSCSVQIDECISNPCQNGGICLDEINGYRCECSLGKYVPRIIAGLGCYQVESSVAQWSRALTLLGGVFDSKSW